MWLQATRAAAPQERPPGRIKNAPPAHRGEGPRTPINPERVSRLTTLGLTEQQARAYLALLDVETATVNDLAGSSRVPRAKLYEVLEGLSRKGLLDTIPGTPQRFRANALSSLYDTRVEELRSEEQQLKRTIGELMVQLMPHPKDAAAESEKDFLHFARGRTVFVAALKQVVARAERSLVLIGDRLLLPRLRLYDDLYAQLSQFQGRGELQILIPQDAVWAVEGRRIHVDEIVESVRTLGLPGGDALLVVRDDAESLEVHFLPNDLHPSRGSDRVIQNRDPEFAMATARLARAAWAAATAVPSGLAARR